MGALPAQRIPTDPREWVGTRLPATLRDSAPGQPGHSCLPKRAACQNSQASSATKLSNICRAQLHHNCFLSPAFFPTDITKMGMLAAGKGGGTGKDRRHRHGHHPLWVQGLCVVRAGSKASGGDVSLAAHSSGHSLCIPHCGEKAGDATPVMEFPHSCVSPPGPTLLETDIPLLGTQGLNLPVHTCLCLGAKLGKETNSPQEPQAEWGTQSWSHT